MHPKSVISNYNWLFYFIKNGQHTNNRDCRSHNYGLVNAAATCKNNQRKEGGKC